MTSLAQEIMADAPTAYWPCSEGTSTTAVDVSGNAHNQTWNAAPVDSTVGTLMGVLLDGSKEATGGAGAAWSRPTNGTIEAWVLSTSSSQTALFTSRASVEGGGPTIYLNSSGYVQAGHLNGITWNSFSQSSGQVWNDGNPHLITYTWTSSGTAVVYVDGVSVVSGGMWGVGSANEPLRLCGENGSRRLNGRVAHAALFSTQLSADRVMAHYRAGMRDKTVAMGLIQEVKSDSPYAYFPMDELTGTTLKDVSGGQDITVSGGFTLNQSLGPLRGISFNGTSGFGSVGTSSYTLWAWECWFKTTTDLTSSSSLGVLLGGGGTTNPIIYTGGNVTSTFSNEIISMTRSSSNGMWVWDSAVGSASGGVPHHLAIRWNGTGYDIYLDMVLVSNNTTGTLTQVVASNLYIARDVTGSYFFNGIIGHAAWYTSNVPVSRFRAHYEAGLRSGVVSAGDGFGG